MATITKKMTQKEIFQLKERISPFIQKETQPAYTHYQVKLDSCSITAYTSGKVVFQGKDLSWMESESKQENKNSYPQAGSDEVGTGDYFGPIVVAACIVDEQNAKALKQLGIQDSKQMNDAYIRKVAGQIAKLCPHSIMIVSNEKYNMIHETHNIVDMKCKLHNQAYVNLRNKGYTLPDFMIIDQFVQEKSYYRYLQKEPNIVRGIHFETKAENKYISVACASVLARNAFLQYWDKMEEVYDFTFQKGAGSKVDTCGKEFVKKYGAQALKKVAKVHFKNTDKILN